MTAKSKRRPSPEEVAAKKKRARARSQEIERDVREAAATLRELHRVDPGAWALIVLALRSQVKVLRGDWPKWALREVSAELDRDLARHRALQAGVPPSRAEASAR
ncbi:MAG TPA: hypothetical protein VK698_22665 [Kofleriaceae bacterium]|nr:hypothetical protein [Kofleriaceae bacterium]